MKPEKPRKEDIAQALGRLADNLSSPNVLDSNDEAANVVDALNQIARGLFAIAKVLEIGLDVPD